MDRKITWNGVPISAAVVRFFKGCIAYNNTRISDSFLKHCSAKTENEYQASLKNLSESEFLAVQLAEELDAMNLSSDEEKALFQKIEDYAKKKNSNIDAVTPTARKYWRMNYRYAGRSKTLAIGVYPQVSLKEARNKRDAAKNYWRKARTHLSRNSVRNSINIL